MEERDYRRMPLRLAYAFLQLNGLTKEEVSIRGSKARVLSYDSTLKRAMVLKELADHNLLDRFITEYWPHGATPEGQKQLSFLNRLYERYLESIGAATESTDIEEAEPPKGTAFAYEAHLRDYLAKNLETLEKGLRLCPVGDEDAVEFPVEGRRVDILAKDKEGVPVVIELKVSRGHERTIGQTLYYRAKIKEMLKVEKVRIFIVALELSPALRAAAREVQDVFLFKYGLLMTITPI